MLGIIISAVGSFTQALGMAKLAIDGLKIVASAIITIGKALGLIKPETKVDELGDKAIQSEFKPEDFDTYEQYVKAVEEYDLDPEKSKEISEEEKLAKGAELSAGVTIERLGDPMGGILNVLVGNPEYTTPERMAEFADLCIKKDGVYIPDLSKYFTGESIEIESAIEIMEMLSDIECKINPDLSKVEANEYVRNIRPDK